jgi:MauM/NapG family ferredoxin protein
VTDQHQLLAGGVSFLVVASLLILSLLWPHIWCRGCCPLGALQDQFSVMTRSARSMLRPATDVPDRVPSGHPVARRTMLGLVAGVASASIFRLAGRATSQPIRPPGAVDELTFEWLCSRCGNCLRSCPYSIIRRETGQRGFAGILTPALTFDKDYCREDCIRCTQVCPSGALAGVDLKNKPDVHIGLAQVDMSLCLLGEDRECSACMRWCPYGAIHYVFSEANYTLVPMIDVGRCNGCGACEVACPTSSRKAIRVFRKILD